MSKVYLTDKRGNNLEKMLIGVGEGKSLNFTISGKYLGEFPVDLDYGTLQEVDIISVLSSVEGAEIGVVVESNFKKAMSSLAFPDLTKTVSNMTGLLYCFFRDGEVEKAKYRQAIFVFRKGAIPPTII